MAQILTPQTQAFIAGTFTDSASGATFETINPATTALLARVTECDSADVDVAVARARDVFEAGSWSRVPPAERKAKLLRLADLIERDLEVLAQLDSQEAGKPITDCRTIDLVETLDTFRWFAETADKLYDQVAPTGPDHLGLLLREPVGVVGAVLPWNFPLLMLAWKAAPALVAGNSLVIKPAEQTSLSALHFGALCAEAGLPDGVVSVLPGFGPTVGKAIGTHPDIDVVTFTGSTEVGRLFLNYSAQTNLKRVVLEMGGKSPQIIMPDALGFGEDMIADMVDAAFWNMGENCSAGSRVVVHEAVKDEVLAQLTAGARALKVGDPADEATQVGPLIDEDQLRKVSDLVQRGIADGAIVATGGDRPADQPTGYFYTPTVLDGVTPDTAVAQEEIFGPVVSVIPFTDESQAIEIANNTRYGLAASLWTKDIDAAFRISRAVKAGTVSVNCYSEGDVTAPFGGFKESGFGGKDKSLASLEQYTESKTIWIRTR